MPDNVLPSTPAQQFTLLDRLMNRLYRKLARQAERQKNIVCAQGAGEGRPGDQGRRGRRVRHGAGPQDATPVSFPGIDGNTHAFVLAAGEVYNTQAGNSALAGLGEEAGTLGQEQMISAHAGGLIGFLKGQVNGCAAEVLREIGNLMWDDEALTVDSSMEAENTGIYVDTSWRPHERQGLKDHYEFAVVPNSMPFRPPEAKLQIITSLRRATADHARHPGRDFRRPGIRPDLRREHATARRSSASSSRCSSRKRAAAIRTRPARPPAHRGKSSAAASTAGRAAGPAGRDGADDAGPQPEPRGEVGAGT